MWANAQRDGRPAEQRCKVWLTPTTWLPCSNAANTRKPLKLGGVPQTGKPISDTSGPKFTILWGHVEEILLLNGVFTRCDRRGDRSSDRSRRSVARPIAATIASCKHRVTNIFRLSIRALVAKIQPDKVVRWCPDGDFWRLFCVLYFQRAACTIFQTCILNSH